MAGCSSFARKQCLFCLMTECSSVARNQRLCCLMAECSYFVGWRDCCAWLQSAAVWRDDRNWCTLWPSIAALWDDRDRCMVVLREWFRMVYFMAEYSCVVRLQKSLCSCDSGWQRSLCHKRLLYEHICEHICKELFLALNMQSRIWLSFVSFGGSGCARDLAWTLWSSRTCVTCMVSSPWTAFVWPFLF